jgi:quercetin dioxygenase-like cupin family protein
MRTERVTTNGHRFQRRAGEAPGRPGRQHEPKVGVRVRALRRGRRVPLTVLARRAGLSPGYLSLVERDMATPSMTALGRLAETLEVPISHFFEATGERAPEHYVVRRQGRRVVLYPGSKVRHELLVADLRGRLEAVYSRVRTGTRSPEYKHDGEEFGFVLKGRMRVTVGDDTFTLGRGDSISYPSHLPHRWEALGGGLEVLWVATPPSW